MTPKIKICGLINSEDAMLLNENQVDFAGFVLFYPKSKRNLTLDKAMEIEKNLDPTIEKVAVTMSPTLEQVRSIEEAGFDYIQIHGELFEQVLEQTKIPIFRGINIGKEKSFNMEFWPEKIAGMVLDGKVSGQGKTFDWTIMDQVPKGEKLLILAGGLHTGNVREGIKVVKPDMVDVSSGVEKENGIGKDPVKIKEFVQAVRRLEFS